MFKEAKELNGYRIKTVAQLTGLSAHVIRKWEHRHGLLRPSRTENGYRSYFEDDLQLLLYVKSQLESGKTIGQLAKKGRELLRKSMTQGPVFIQGISQAIHSQAVAIIRTAQCLDRTTAEEKIHCLMVQFGLERALRHVFFPLLKTVGDLWHRGEMSITGEHMISQAVRRYLVEGLKKNNGSGGPTAIVACAPCDFHEIGALTAALYLKNSGWQVVYLGPDSEIDVIRLACERRKYQLIILSVVLDRSREEFTHLAETIAKKLLPYCPVILGGRGTTYFTDLIEHYGIQGIDDLNNLHNLRPSTYSIDQKAHQTIPSMIKECIQ